MPFLGLLHMTYLLIRAVVWKMAVSGGSLTATAQLPALMRRSDLAYGEHRCRRRALLRRGVVKGR